MTNPGGLTAAELALLLPELAAALRGARISDVARPADRDDLLLWFDTEQGRLPLQIALGAARARLCPTQRRWRRDEQQTGPRLDRLRERLVGAQFVELLQPAGERRCSLVLRHPEHGRSTLEVELFGARGLWALLDAGGRILELSRLPESKERVLRPGEVYAPPPARARTDEPAPRFTPPLLDMVDATFTAADLAAEQQERRQRVQTALERALRSLTQRIAGLEQQQRQAQEAPALRQRADLLLAYASLWRRGDSELLVPDPDAPEQMLRLPVDPQQPLPRQAEKLYARARSLTAALAIGAERLTAARSEQERLLGWHAELDTAEDARLGELAQELQRAGLLRGPAPKPDPKPKSKPGTRAGSARTNFREFTSAEGLTILCGRTNEQNDQLSVRVARGNDLWLHVGGGRAGSHVVVRLPKGKSASLETLLDAATVAVHFSKARGEPLCEVVYTQAKHVRKPKGFPPGRVTITQEKSLRVKLEPERLRRLLQSSGGADDGS